MVHNSVVESLVKYTQVMLGYEMVTSHGSLHHQNCFSTASVLVKSRRYLSNPSALQLGKYVSLFLHFDLNCCLKAVSRSQNTSAVW